MRERDAAPDGSGLPIGALVEVEVGAVAHGGHCVARHAGQVLFVRHTLPGEQVRARITGAGPGNRYLHADAIEILRPAAGRRASPCPAFRPGGCGGCDWLHATPQMSRELKQAVCVEAFARFGPRPGPSAEQLAPLPVHPADLGWRTRTNLAVDAAGRAGLRVHHSREILPLPACPQLTEPGAGGAFERVWEPHSSVRWVSPSGGGAALLSARPRGVLVETASGRKFDVAADGFWLAHSGAAQVLAQTVGEFLAARDAEQIVDLYAGVGLFGLTLLAGTPGLRVRLVEGDKQAASLARRNSQRGRGGRVEVTCAPVEKWVRRPGSLSGVDAVVLDPPRKGAGRAVLGAIAAADPSRICYVACDPVALARDAATLADHGYSLADIRVFDLFPNTKHIESVALFRRQPA